MTKKIVKINCEFCKKIMWPGYMTRHLKICELNPINTRFCEVCDSIVKNFRQSRTCGYACANKLFRTGQNHGNWKESAYRTTCFLFHEKKCIVCNESNIVEVHHYDNNHRNNSPRNLIPLCPTHHKYCHSRYKKLIAKTVNEYWIERDDLKQGTI